MYKTNLCLFFMFHNVELLLLVSVYRVLVLSITQLYTCKSHYRNIIIALFYRKLSEICLLTVKCNSKEGDFRSKIFFKLFMTRLKIEKYYILEILFILQTISILFDSDKKSETTLTEKCDLFCSIFGKQNTIIPYRFINECIHIYIFGPS